MNVVGAIRRIILDDIAGTEGTLLGGRVYPVVVAQSKVLPAACIGLVDVGPTDRKTGVSDLDFVMVSISSFSFDYYEAHRIDEAIRDCIDGFSGSVITTEDGAGHNIQNISYVSTADSFAAEQAVFVRETRYRVSYRRSGAPLPEGEPLLSSWPQALSQWPVYDSHEAAETAGATYYRASANHRALHGTMFFKGLTGSWDTTEEGGNYIKFAAGENLSSGRVVVIDDDKAYYFNPSDTTHAGRAYGVTVTSATTGNNVSVVSSGELTDAAFTFAADKTLWVGLNGEITDTYPGLAVAQKAGVSSGSAKMKIDFSIQAIN